jgi:YVTN family beta-propeller protein
MEISRAIYGLMNSPQEDWMRFLRKTPAILACLLFLVFELGCGDQYRPIANPIVSPGGQPQNTYSAYVLNYNPAGFGSTTKIDVSGNSNLQVLSMSYGSVAMAFQGSVRGAVFVANRDADSVSEYTLVGTTTVINIGLAPGSRPVAITGTASTYMYVANSGTNSFCPLTGSVSVISTASLVATSTVCVGINPVAIAQQAGGGYVYIANQGDNTVSVFNPVSGSVSGTITQAGGLHQNPIATVASPDGAYIFVVCQGNGTSPGAVDIINTATNTIGGSVPVGIGPTSIYLDTFLNRLYIANTGDNTVTVLNSADVALGVTPPIPTLATVRVGSSPVSVAALPNGLSFYVANTASNNVSVVSSSSFSVVATVPVGSRPVFVATEPSSTKVYAANGGSGTISIIQTSNNSVAVNMPAPQQDANCDPKVSTCAPQQPIQIMTM